jgi:hypothetical protein
MSQMVKCAEVFLGKPRPPLTVNGRPKVAGQAPRQTLAAIVDLDERLLAVIAAIHGTTVPPAAVASPRAKANASPQARASRLDEALDLL